MPATERSTPNSRRAPVECGRRRPVADGPAHARVEGAFQPLIESRGSARHEQVPASVCSRSESGSEANTRGRRCRRPRPS
jgi:hypothetical protein